MGGGAGGGGGGGWGSGPGWFNEILRGFEMSQSNAAHNQKQSLNRHADTNDKAWSGKAAVHTGAIVLLQPLPKAGVDSSFVLVCVIQYRDAWEIPRRHHVVGVPAGLLHKNTLIEQYI